jgi:hypothetical protein
MKTEEPLTRLRDSAKVEARPGRSRAKMFVAIYGISVTAAILLSYGLRWLIRWALQ